MPSASELGTTRARRVPSSGTGRRVRARRANGDHCGQDLGLAREAATRGAVAVGDFLAEGSGPFIVGPAVDEAAEAMEASAGAFIMATSSAIGPLERLAASMKGEPDEELDRRFPGQRQLTCPTIAIVGASPLHLTGRRHPHIQAAPRRWRLAFASPLLHNSAPRKNSWVGRAG
jgi:hypothetical protein